MMFRFMGFLGWAAISIAALSCNPAKHAIRQKEAIDKAIAEHILNNPIPYSEILIPGDTVIMRDTIDHEVVLIDTFFIQDTVRIEIAKWKTILKTNRVVDTFIRTVNNETAIRRLMEERAALQSEVKTLETQKKLNFWIIVALIAVAAASIMFGFRKSL